MKEKILNKLKARSLSEIMEEIKWVSGYINKYKKIIFLYFALGLFSALLTVGGSVLSKNLIDIVTGFQKSSIAVMTGAYVSFGIVRIISSSISSRISTKYSTLVTNEIQYEMYQQSLKVEWRYIKKFHAGDLIGRISNDVSTVSNTILTWLPNFVITIVQSICCIVVILRYDPIMALISIISTPVMVLLSRTLMYKMRIFSKKSRESASRIMSFIQESYSNVQSIKAFGIIEDFNIKFKMIQQEYFDVVMQQNKFSVLTGILMSTLGLIVSYSCYGWGIYRLWSGFITFGTMTMFIQLAGYLSGSFSALVSMVPSAINSLTAIRRLMDIVELPKEFNDEAVDVEVIKNESQESGISIDIENARFLYDDSDEIFTCLDFEAKPEQVTAIVGPSGSGKTTIFRILLGVAALSGGTGKIDYSFNGQKKEFNLSPSTRGLFAYVPQGNAIFYGTVAENLRIFNRRATDSELTEALKAACAYDFVLELEKGMDTLIEEGGTNLSEGQKQRLCIARALVSDAPIILLDEGTSALDKETERKLLKNLSTFKSNKTFIVSTHRTSVLDICDRTYSIEDKTLTQLLS